MKRYLSKVVLGIWAVACLNACQLADDAQSNGAYEGTIAEVTIVTRMPDGFKPGVAYKNQEVVLKNERMIYRAQTDENGKALFKNVIPNVYTVFTSWELSPEVYADMAVVEGVENRPVILASSLLKQQLFESKVLELSLNKSVKQTLLISKIYASGTKAKNGTSNYIADKYIEVFNNSETVEYIDGLYLALTEAESTPAYPAATNPGYIYVRQVFQFPGNGTDYPVEPGKSIVVCNSAINHIENAPRSVNLFEADFEAKNTIYSNNALVPDIKQVYSNAQIAFLNLINGGDNGVVLFKTTDNIADYPNFFIPGKDKGSMYKRIPDSTILDGVETLKNKTAGIDTNTKRIPSFVDSSYGFINALSGYTNESIERRVDKAASTQERVYLIDTNNSLSDFRTVTDPSPRSYDKPLLLEN